MAELNKIVVGGGIAGILASILLKKTNPEHTVYLIESEPECGGLLRSIKSDKGTEFDYGTHILGETGIRELDELLTAGMNQQDWYCLPKLKPGNVVNGHFHKYSQLLYAKALPEDKLAKATYELLSADFEQGETASNLAEYCTTVYGKTFTDELLAPLMHKLMSVPAEQLHKSAHCLFGYDRIIIGPAQMMRELKKSEHLDSILGFESYDEGVSSLNNYYPKHGKGIGLWVDNLVNQAKSLGVEVLTGTAINQMHVSDGKITQISTAQGQHLNCDQLIWTIPLFPLIKFSELDFTPQYRPIIRKMRLHHFVFDRPFATHNFHVYCNQPEMESFRITLYPNIAAEGEQNGEHRCTVEVLSEREDDIEVMEASILNELKQMGVVEQQANVTEQFTTLISNGFPVYTNEFVNELKRQRDCITGQLDNVLLLGKASANSFFMADVLAEVFSTLSPTNE